MPNLVLPWKRLWYPREGNISLWDDGFLVDPDSDFAKYYPSAAVPFEVVARGRCVVFLGEPGIGKSTALKAEFENLRNAVRATGDDCLWCDLRDFSSDDRLEKYVFENAAFARWRTATMSCIYF